MRIQYRQHSRDLFAEFNCSCPDPKWTDSGVAHLFKTKIRLTGYADNYFFDEVNKEPKTVVCGCKEKYSVQWFRDGVEVRKEKCDE